MLKNNLDKFLICHITDLIKTTIENLFHESNEKLKEGCMELRDLIIHWYNDKYTDRSDKINLITYKRLSFLYNK